MEIEDGEVAEVARRQHAPVAPAARDGKLPQLAKPVRLCRDVADAVRHARRVELARVVAEACFGEDVVRPRCPAIDRERRRAVRQWAPTARRRDDLDRALQISAELVRCLIVDACVRVPVSSGLVPPPDDLGREVAVVGDGHPEQEERRAGVQLVEQIEQVRRLTLERPMPPVPVGEAEPPVDELVPILEVDRQQEPRLLHREQT